MLRPCDRAVLSVVCYHYPLDGRMIRDCVNACVPWWKFWGLWSAAAVQASLVRLQAEGIVEATAEDYVLDGIPLRRFLYTRRCAR